MNDQIKAEIVGNIVRGVPLHGAPFFGTAAAIRRNHHVTGLGWHEYEVRIDVDNGRMRTESWLDGNRVEPATLNDVLTHFEQRERAYEDRIKKLRDMVGRKVPKFNPDKHLGVFAQYLSDAYRHEDGSITYVFGEPEPVDHDSPRTYDGNVATLINRNSRTIDVDEDDAGLAEAVERWDYGFGGPAPSRNRPASRVPQTTMMRRYIGMFRPDILHFDWHWSAGDSFGWGYVTREKWEKAMGKDYDGDVTPEQAFDQEVKIYGLWANNEIYASAHVTKRGEDPDMVWGHLGYDDNRDIAAYHTDSPILEVLA